MDAISDKGEEEEGEGLTCLSGGVQVWFVSLESCSAQLF